ncbi:hypothetical protein [Campylobacter hominis]
MKNYLFLLGSVFVLFLSYKMWKEHDITGFMIATASFFIVFGVSVWRIFKGKK